MEMLIRFLTAASRAPVPERTCGEAITEGSQLYAARKMKIASGDFSFQLRFSERRYSSVIRDDRADSVITKFATSIGPKFYYSHQAANSAGKQTIGAVLKSKRLWSSQRFLTQNTSALNHHQFSQMILTQGDGKDSKAGIAGRRKHSGGSHFQFYPLKVY